MKKRFLFFVNIVQTDSPDHEKHASYHLKDRQIKSAFELTTWAGPSILFLAGVRSIGVLDVQSGWVFSKAQCSS